MLKHAKPKGQTPVKSLGALKTLSQRNVGQTHGLTMSLMLGLTALYATVTCADTVYRCGDAYSSSTQCANGQATEVKPMSDLRITGQEKTNTAAHEMREAQTLEKQRRQAEHPPAQTAAVRLSTPSAFPPPIANIEPTPHSSTNKHAHKPQSPYFTAVDPKAASKKKSTAKAVPINHP